jgi:hypothetical protein
VLGSVRSGPVGRGSAERPQRRRRRLAQPHRRHRRAAQRRRHAKPQPFIVAEEEQPVLHDGAAERPTELILAHRRLLQAAAVGEPVVRIQRFVAEVLERGTVKRVRARARVERDLAARLTPELRAICRGLDAELLECIHRQQPVVAAGDGLRGRRSGDVLADAVVDGDGGDVGADAIDHEVVGVVALTVHADLSLLLPGGARQHDAWHQREQRLKAPAIHRQRFHELAIDHGADGRRRVDARGLDDDRDRLADGGHFQLQLERDLIVHVQDDVRHFERREPVAGGGEPIASRRQHGNDEAACLVRGRLPVLLRGRVEQRDLHVGDGRIGFVGDGAGECRGRGLRGCEARREGGRRDGQPDHDPDESLHVRPPVRHSYPLTSTREASAFGALDVQ